MTTINRQSSSSILGLCFIFFCYFFFSSVANAGEESGAVEQLESINVWSDSLSSAELGYTSPSSILLPRDMISINAVTTEDLVKYEPSLIIRRRFIGDSNGTLGIRGSNMFQTSRSMVFSDGVPLHYLLQTRWNGAPRWSLVSASEIEKVEVLYGPFSAEYSGNSMGGVVLVETRIPDQEEFHADISAFSQQFNAYGFDDSVHGYKGFVSYGNKVGGLSYYLSFNRLDNESQPQTFRNSSLGSVDGSEQTVTGGIRELDARARDRFWFGDTGTVNTITDNYKVKLGYDFGHWESLLNLAFEDRMSQNIGNSYIKDEAGNFVYNGSNFNSSGNDFALNSSRINDNRLKRESVSAGLRLKGNLSEATKLHINLSQFDIQKDQRRSSAEHPLSSTFTGEGNIAEYDGSGWQTAEIKLINNDFALHGLQIISGLRHENYKLTLDQFDTSSYLSSDKGVATSRFGGRTKLDAAFMQANWDFLYQWDIAFGLRYEEFESSGGFYSEAPVGGAGLTLIAVPSVNVTELSPKFSVGYQPHDEWLIRYSIAQAYRFPIAEELFRQFRDFNSINEANPELRPEEGTHHNLMAERTLDDGYLRINFFHETIENAIDAQSTTTLEGQSISTFVPIDKTQVSGIELVLNQRNIISRLDLRFNAAYTRAKIVENLANPQWEGNVFPRMPKWRANVLATFHLSPRWDFGLNVQYTSDSFGRVQNDDTVDNVFGAQDGYTRFGMKTTYDLTAEVKASIGIDNLGNDVAYVAHPWPGRTLYLNLRYDR